MSRLVDFIAPPLTIRRQFVTLCRQIPSVLRTEGPFAVWQSARTALRRYQRTGALIVPPAPHAETSTVPFAYTDWIADNEPTEDELLHQAREQSSLTYRPLISIIVPVFNPPPHVLVAAIQSVKSQTYTNWQLCLADGASTDPDVMAVLDKYSDEDRVSIVRLERNLGISGNSNAALALAYGEYIALLDHDDVLAPNMLFEVAKLLNLHPETDIIYFDEDKISAEGSHRDQPLFKPDFSPDLLLSANLLMHGVFRRSLVDQVGGFDPGMDGAQDWDLVLRCARHTLAIRHIPKILYHWRQVSGSVAATNNAKPWAIDAQVKAVRRHIEATDGISPRVDVPHLGQTRIFWPQPTSRISIVIPTRDNLAVLSSCVESILTKTDYADYEIVLVDTGSILEETHTYYRDLLEQYADVKVAKLPGPFNYSHANNVGAREASGDLLLFLNNDTEVIEPDWLAEMAAWALRPGVGVVGGKLLHVDGRIQHAGIIIGHSGPANHIFATLPEGSFGIFGSTEWYRTYHAVTGACMMVSRDVFTRLGGFDEVYQLAYSDVDLCLRAEGIGLRTVYTPFARLFHKEGSSRGFHLPRSDILRCVCQTLPTIRQGDGNFNPNLSLNKTVPTMAEPGERTSAQSLFELLSAYDLLPPPQTDSVPSIEEINLAQPAPWPTTASKANAKSFEDLNVLLVAAELSSDDSRSGLVSLAEACAAFALQTTLFTTADWIDTEQIQRDNVIVQIESSVPYQGPDRKPMSGVDLGPLTRAMAGTDLVIVYGLASSLAITAAVAFDVASILWLDGVDAICDAQSLDARVHEALNTANLIVFADERAMAGSAIHVPPDRIKVMPCGPNEDLPEYRKHLIELIASVAHIRKPVLLGHGTQ